MPTQKQMYYAAEKHSGGMNRAFMDLVNCKNNPLTREDLARNIERRPTLWKRYEGFLETLPTRAAIAKVTGQ